MHRGRAIFAISAVCALAPLASPALAGESNDDEIARDAVLKLTDLPDTWEVGQPDEEDDELFGSSECRAADRAFESIYDEIDGQLRAYEEPEIISPDTVITATDIENAVALFPNTRAAKRVLRTFETAETRACFEQAALDSAADLDVSEGVFEPLDVSAGDGALGFTIIISDGVREEAFFLDLVIARVGRALTVFSSLNVGASLPEIPEALDVVTGRLERAL